MSWTTAPRAAVRSSPVASSSRSSIALSSRTRVGHVSQRTLATEVPSDPLETPPVSTPPRTLPYTLLTSLILARAPLLTSTPTPLESTYYAYQSRIQRALATPFPAEFYFKKGTLLERRFLAEERLCELEAFGEGFEGEEGAERIEDVPSEEDEVRVLEREHESDKAGDVKDLNRRGERHLYLLVKPSGPEGWRFPVWKAGLDQPLHTSVKQSLTESFGPNMNTWMVSRQPIAVVQGSSSEEPSKTFFFKGRIFAGRPTIADSQKSFLSELAWLTTEEIAERVDKEYWESVKELLPKV